MGIEIPQSEFEFSFARSSGPGGQNVNKVNSKALLRWSIVLNSTLSEQVKARFLAKFKNRLTVDGDVLITSDRFRDQLRNQNDCIEKLNEMLRSVEHPPKLRKKTKASYSSKLKLKSSKQKHGAKKSSRRRPSHED